MIGRSIAHYKITQEIGRGGMGEVYLATDTKLKRKVAIKVLSEALSGDEQHMARLTREAEVLASLDHPGIGQIYGIEDTEGGKALVLQFIEGPTLADRIAQGPVPVEEALPIALEIAEALEAAHEKGIIHRDLKPANIKFNSEGKVRILDFGLAKAVEKVRSDEGSSDSPTLTMQATQAGIILGTAAYMSPEQAKGKPVDKRSDIWAFGVVLFEMLTGTQPFAGEDITEVLASVVQGEPAWDRLPAKASSDLRRFLHWCLTRDSDGRLRDVGDARLWIETIMAERDGLSSAPTRKVRGPGWLQLVAWGLSVLAVAALIVWAFLPDVPVTSAFVQVVLPSGVHLPVHTDHPTLALSPDGSQLVFIGEQDGVRRLYRRNLSEPEFHVVEGTEGAASPFLSPNGDFVGFLSGTQLKTVSIESGIPTVASGATPTTTNRGSAWIDADTIVYVGSANAPLKKLGLAPQVSGDDTKAWIDLSDLPGPSAWPSRLPDGRVLLNDFSDGPENLRIAAVSLDPADSTLIATGGTNPRYSSTGHVLYARRGSLYAIGFDPRSLQTYGNEHKLLEGVIMGDTGAAQFSVSDNGTLAFVAGDSTSSEYEFVRVDRSGKTEVLFGSEHKLFDPRLSPDGSKLAFMSPRGTNFDVWVLDLVRGSLERWTSHPGEDFFPVWRHDGMLALATEIGEDAGEAGPALGIRTSPSSPTEQVFQRPGKGDLEFPSSWSRNGRLLAFVALDGSDGDSDIYVLQTESRQAEAIVATPFGERSPVFSPDGNWLAFSSNRTGRWEVYVQAFPDAGPPIQLSTSGGGEPVWGPEGREIFYRSQNRLMAVKFATSVDRPGAPEALFVDRFEKAWTMGHANYDVSSDGNHFIMVRRKNMVTPNVINVVFNWPGVLGRSD